MSNSFHCMGCKKIFNKESKGSVCKRCKCKYKLNYIFNNKIINNEDQILQTKENKKKLMYDLLSRNLINNINIEEIKIKIENDAEKKVIELNRNINSFNDFKKQEIGNLLINIMKTGADEFKEKTGRNMTYSEMRNMFG